MRLTTGRNHRPLLALILVLLIAAGVLAHAAFGAARSDAAQDGVMLSYGGWTVGTRQLASGEFVYCVEPGAITPAGDQLAAAEVEVLRGYSFFTYDDTGWAGVTASEPISGEPLRRINYLLSRYGDTSEATQAVAVQFAIWLLRESPGEAPWLDHHIAWVEANGGAAEIARAHELVAEARAAALPPSSLPPAPLAMALGETHGHGTVSYPAGAVELRIDGGTFADGSRRLLLAGDGAGIDTAGSAQWRADLHAEGWEGEREVIVSGDWSTSEAGWPARLLVYPSVVSAEQTLAWAVGPVSEAYAGAFDAVSARVETSFSPTLTTTVVQELLTVGRDPFADTIELGVADGSGPWPEREGSDGAPEHLPLLLEGVVYGPFAEPQAVSDQAPEGAPVAARVELVVDGGPGGYEAIAQEAPSGAGFYYWVWTISEAVQDPATREAGGLPEGYRFSDSFGLPSERHEARMPDTPVASVAAVAPTALARTGAGLPAPLAGTGALLLGAGLLLGAAPLVIRRLRRALANAQRSCRASR